MCDDIDIITDDGVMCTYPPWNFTWVVPGKIAAFAWPQSVENLEYLIEEGIGDLVTLSPEKQPPIDKLQNPERLRWTVIAVDEFEPPTLEDIGEFIRICEDSHKRDKAVGVHCRMGRGRTGVMLACYLVRFQDLTPDAAITNVRLQRPHSIETAEQERATKLYHDSLRGTKVGKN